MATGEIYFIIVLFDFVMEKNPIQRIVAMPIVASFYENYG